MLEPGNFVSTGFGYGLILNKHKGDPNLFYGKEPIVIDVIYDNSIIFGLELGWKTVKEIEAKDLGEKEEREVRYNIIDGIFTKINMNNLERVK